MAIWSRNTRNLQAGPQAPLPILGNGRIKKETRSKAVVSVLVLVFVALWFILRGDLFYVLNCVFLFLCFSVLLALRLPRLGKRELISAFRTFVRFVLVWICRFPLPLGVWEGQRFVIVALPESHVLLKYGRSSASAFSSSTTVIYL